MQILDNTPAALRLSSTNSPPRTRAIIEWIEGDFGRPPVVFPLGESDENDDVIRSEIQRRWS
jgi:hypothetical protein